MASGLLRNITWLGAGHAVVKPVWLFFITVVCMRLLGTHEYGVMTAALFLMSIASSFTGLGITRYSIREVARDYDRAHRFFSNFVLFRGGLSFVVFGLAMGIGVLLDYRGSDLLALAFAGVYAMALELTNYCRAFYRAHEKMKYEALSTIVEKLLVVGIGAAVLYLYRSAPGVLAGMTAGMILTLVLNIAWVSRRMVSFQPALLDFSFLSSSFRRAIPLGLASLFVVLYMRIDAVMVEAMVGEEAAGQYGAAFRLLQALIVLPTIVQTALFPRLSDLFDSANRRNFKQILRRSIGGLTAISLPIAAAVAYFAPDIIHLMDPNPAFAPAASALQILIWTFPFMAVNNVLNTTLIASDDQRMAAGLLGGAVVFNIGLNLALIPLYSFYGACVATLLTEVAITGAMALRYRTYTYQKLASPL